MRKYLLIIIAFIVIAIFFLIVFGGLQIGKLRLYSYKEIASIGKEKNDLLTALDDKNNNEYGKTLKSLQTISQTYQKTKNDYDKLSQEGKITGSSINTVDLFDANILGEDIRKYAIENKTILTLNIVQSKISTAISSEYVMCDLNFDVSGEYTSIKNFIDNIEKNEKFDFEIKNFTLVQEDEFLKATFSIENVPISSQSLSN